MNNFTTLFLVALAIGSLVQLWLVARQAIHVKRHRHQVPQAFAEQISLEQHHKAADYTLARLSLQRWELTLAPVLILLWTLGGLLNWLDAAWLQVGSDWGLSPLWQGTLLALSVLLIGAVLDTPLSLWSTFGVERRFGFNRTTVARYLKDKLLGLLLALALGVPLLLVILWLMASAGEFWWLYAWLVWFGSMLLLTWIYPLWIAPLFNKFQPLQESSLRSRLEALLKRCGFESNGMFVMDGSTRSAHGNAYFTGFGRAKRIVFFDTLLDGLNEDQVEAVLAHELGHFKRKHIRKMLITNALMSLGGLALLGWLSQQSWFYTGLGVARETPALALLLFMLLMPVFGVFLSPVMAAFSRKHEFEADDYAAEQTNAQALIDGLVSMYRDNASTLTPDPLYSAFHHSHPPAPVRIAHLASKL